MRSEYSIAYQMVLDLLPHLSDEELNILGFRDVRDEEESRRINWPPPLANNNDWDRLRATILIRDNFICRYCGSRGDAQMHVDHVVPRSRGGLDSPDNLVAACPPCNRSKHARTPEQWQP